MYEGKKHKIPSGTIPAKPISSLPYDVATLVSDLSVYYELNVYWSNVRPMIIGLIGLRPIWILIDFAITGWKPNILGYSSTGDIVPDVNITDGNDFHIGCMDNEQSRQDNVNTGSAMFPSIGCG